MDLVHILGKFEPDYIIVFGPNEGALPPRWLPARFERVVVLNEYGYPLYRPEFLWRWFAFPIPRNFDAESQGVKIYRRRQLGVGG